MNARTEIPGSDFDRQLGRLDGLPDVSSTRPSVIRNVPLLGAGQSQLYVVQTFRHKEMGDMIFLEHVGEGGTVRLVLPAKVADAIARQRDQLSKVSRSKASRASAQERMDRGEHPAFLKRKSAAS